MARADADGSRALSARTAPLERAVVADVAPVELGPAQVAREFRALQEEGVTVRAAGDAGRDPRLLSGYGPQYKVELFGTTFYLSRLRDEESFRFFVAYVMPATEAGRPARRRGLYPRIFYKDSSLVWRAATHVIRSEEENWIGKGDLKVGVEDGVAMEYSAEETTNLPLELQTPLDVLSRRGGRVRRDLRAVEIFLRAAPDDRFEPYRDFSEPRRRAMADPRNRVNGGRPVAGFARPGDPASLEFVAGFEPDFAHGVIETAEIMSRIYGGAISKHRVLSRNREIQYQFIGGPRQAWIIPPQTLTTELSSYGVRTVDVLVDEDLCVPGLEYHYWDDSEDPPRLHSQIPEGFAGAASEVDPSRADASPWIEKLPVIQEYRRLLGPGQRSTPRRTSQRA